MTVKRKVDASNEFLKKKKREKERKKIKQLKLKKRIYSNYVKPYNRKTWQEEKEYRRVVMYLKLLKM